MHHLMMRSNHFFLPIICSTQYKGNIMSQARIIFSAPTALILDFDEVINDSCKPDDDTGFIGGELINPESFKNLLEFCIRKNIPCHIVTARADNKLNQAHVAGMIHYVGGFYDGIGGFKLENLHFLGVEHVKNQKSTLIALKETKLSAIDKIFEKEQCRSKSDMLFVEDDLKHLDPVKDAGYSTIQAKPNEKYMEEALTFLQIKIAQCHTVSGYKGRTLFPPKPKAAYGSNNDGSASSSPAPSRSPSLSPQPGLSTTPSPNTSPYSSPNKKDSNKSKRTSHSSGR